MLILALRQWIKILLFGTYLFIIIYVVRVTDTVYAKWFGIHLKVMNNLSLRLLKTTILYDALKETNEP